MAQKPPSFAASFALVPVLLLVSVSCGKPDAPSEALTDFPTTRGHWTAKKLYCTGKEKPRTETPLQRQMSLDITDRTISGTVVWKKCSLSWISRIRSVTTSKVRVRNLRITCPLECEPRLCDSAPPEGDTEFSYRLERSIMVFVQNHFGSECDPGEVYFERK